MPNLDCILVNTKTDKVVADGDRITSFRGEEYFYRYISRAPSQGKEGKITVSTQKTGASLGDQEYYPSVFGLKIYSAQEVVDKALQNPHTGVFRDPDS